jgi:hypothetical protein
MTRPVNFPDRNPMNVMMVIGFMMFVQRMANRVVQGWSRYGQPNRRQRYSARMRKELDSYDADGNMEHLLNIANYCWLESEKPWNEKFHFDNSVDSVTRGEFGT